MLTEVRAGTVAFPEVSFVIQEEPFDPEQDFHSHLETLESSPQLPPKTKRWLELAKTVPVDRTVRWYPFSRLHLARERLVHLVGNGSEAWIGTAFPEKEENFAPGGFFTTIQSKTPLFREIITPIGVDQALLDLQLQIEDRKIPEGVWLKTFAEPPATAMFQGAVVIEAQPTNRTADLRSISISGTWEDCTLRIMQDMTDPSIFFSYSPGKGWQAGSKETTPSLMQSAIQVILGPGKRHLREFARLTHRMHGKNVTAAELEFKVLKSRPGKIGGPVMFLDWNVSGIMGESYGFDWIIYPPA